MGSDLKAEVPQALQGESYEEFLILRGPGIIGLDPPAGIGVRQPNGGFKAEVLIKGMFIDEIGRPLGIDLPDKTGVELLDLVPVQGLVFQEGLTPFPVKEGQGMGSGC